MRHLLVLLVFLLAACVMTAPLCLHLGTHLPSLARDPLFVTWIFAWDAHHILSLDFRHFFGGNIYYPWPYALTYSDHLLGYQPVVLPIYALTGNILLAYNVAFLVTFVLVGYFTYLLMRRLLLDAHVLRTSKKTGDRGQKTGGEDTASAHLAATREARSAEVERVLPPASSLQPPGSSDARRPTSDALAATRNPPSTIPAEAAAIFAGLAFAFVPFRVQHWYHISLAGFEWMPLALLCLHRLFGGPREESRIQNPEARMKDSASLGPRTEDRGSDALPPASGLQPPASLPDTHSALRWGLVAGVAAAMQLLTGMYEGMYLALLIALFVPYFLLATGAWRRGRVWLALVAAAGIVALTNGGIAAIYAHAHKVLGLTRTTYEFGYFSLPLINFAHVPPVNRLLPQLGVPAPPDEVERQAWFGLVVVVCALVGFLGPLLDLRTRRRIGWLSAAAGLAVAGGLVIIVRAPRTIQPEGGLLGREHLLGFGLFALAAILFVARLLAPGDRGARFVAWLRYLGRGPLFYTLAGIFFFVLSLGPVVQLTRNRPLFQNPVFLFVERCVPGFSGMRVTARLSIVVSLCLTVLAGYGVAAVLRRPRTPGGRVVCAGLLSALLLAEFYSAPLPLSRIPFGPDERAFGTWLAKETVNGRPPLVAHVPVEGPNVSTFGEYWMYLSTFHWRPMVNGVSAYRPLPYRLMKAELDRFPVPEAIERLQAMGVNYVIVNTNPDAGGVPMAAIRDPRLSPVKEFGALAVFAVPPPSATWQDTLKRPDILRLPPTLKSDESVAAALDLPDASSLALLMLPVPHVWIAWTGPGALHSRERLILDEPLGEFATRRCLPFTIHVPDTEGAAELRLEMDDGTVLLTRAVRVEKR